MERKWFTPFDTVKMLKDWTCATKFVLFSSHLLCKFVTCCVQCTICLVSFSLLLILSTSQIGTPICIPSQEFIDIGRIASIENNHKPVDYAKKGQKVAIKVCAWIKVEFYIMNLSELTVIFPIKRSLRYGFKTTFYLYYDWAMLKR